MQNKKLEMQNEKLKLRNRGQVMMITVVMSMVIGLIVVVGGSATVSRDAQIAREEYGSKQAFVTVESGEEDVTYRIKKAWSYQSPETLTIDGFTATTTITDNAVTGLRQVRATGTAGVALNLLRKKSLDLIRGDNVTFNYGVQVGNGGIVMANSASILGNVYSNGSITGSGNYIYGSAVSAGASGLVNNIHSTSTVKAHTIQNSTIDRDAYYQTISNTTVSGTSYPGSTDQPSQEFPISDATLDEWEADAAAGTIVNCTGIYEIKNTTVTIGPTKYTCSVTIKGSTVTLAGPVWVEGDIDFNTSSVIKVSSTLGRKSVAMIADLQSNRSTGSKITISQSTTFQNSGTAGSYIALVSRNTSSENGGATTAIDLQQTATGAVLLYSNHGFIDIGNSSNLKEVTGYKIRIKNSAQLIYETGLENSVFDTGPGGTWNVFDWREQ